MVSKIIAILCVLPAIAFAQDDLNGWKEVSPKHDSTKVEYQSTQVELPNRIATSSHVPLAVKQASQSICLIKTAFGRVGTGIKLQTLDGSQIVLTCAHLVRRGEQGYPVSVEFTFDEKVTGDFIGIYPSQGNEFRDIGLSLIHI